MKKILCFSVLICSFSAIADCRTYVHEETNGGYDLCAEKKGNVLSNITWDTVDPQNIYYLKKTKYNARAVCKAFGYKKVLKMTSKSIGYEGIRLNLKNRTLEMIGMDDDFVAVEIFPVRVLDKAICQ